MPEWTEMFIFARLKVKTPLHYASRDKDGAPFATRLSFVLDTL